ncbi:MAG: hypothetical protein FJX72_15970 [Armatimonadetes bacterium]|nr:hypothetical protein [Armatimonadota bacterium]
MKKPTLEQVRSMPDQTFDAALKALHISAQDRGPTLLSLVGDNRKVIVERTGEVGFGPLYLDFVQHRSRRRIRPTFGSGSGHAFSENGVGSPAGYSRALDNGWMPMPRIGVVEDGVTYIQTTFVAPTGPDPQGARPLCVTEIVATNTSDGPREASVRLAFVADAEKKVAAHVRLDGTMVTATEGAHTLAFADTAGCVGLTARADGGELTLRGSIAPGEHARCWVYAPMEWEAGPDELQTLGGGSGLKRAAEDYWRSALAPSMRLQTPDELLNNTIMASQAHCMIAARNEENGKLIDPWISSTYYASLDTESHAILYGMDLMGQHDFARKGYEFFRKRQNPAGYLSHGYTLMGTGQHLWFLSDHFRLTGDQAWWRGIEANMVKVADWVVRQAAKTRAVGPGRRQVPQHGLMPPGTVADWQDWGYIFSMQGYYYAGLSRVASALAEIGNPQAGAFARAAARLGADIRRAYGWTQARTPAVDRGDGVWIPGSPYQLLKPGPCEQFFPNYSGAWLYDVELGAHHMADQGVFAPDSPEIGWMADYLEGHQFLRDGITTGALDEAGNRKDWFNRGGFPHAQPYYGRYPELCARRDDVKPFIRSYFNQLAPSINREDLSIYENPGASVWNKTHETGHFLQQSRLMFVMERGDALWLAPFVTNRWMQDGMAVAVEQAPTFFGDVGFRIVSHAAQGAIEATITPPTRRAPKEIVIRLRHPEGKPMRSVMVNGKPHRAFDAAREIVRLKPGRGVIVVRAQY